MKDSAWYNKLWQDKMLELPLEGDVTGSWQNMRGLLDKNMPVNSPVAIKNPSKSLVSRIITVAVIVIAAILLYFAAKHLFADNQPKTNKEIIKPVNPGANSGVGKTSYQGNNSAAKDNSAGTKHSPTNNTRDSAAIANGAKSINTTATASAKKIKNNGQSNQFNVVANNTPLTVGKTKGRHSTGKAGKIKYLSNDTRNNSPITGRRGSNTVYSQSNTRQNFGTDLASQTKTGKGKTSSGIYKSAADSINALLTGNGSAQPTLLSSNNLPDSSKKANSALLAANKSSSSTIKKPDSTAAKTNAAKAANKPRVKPAKISNPKFELGLKIGVNSNGSFTSPYQNNNFYGKSSVDAFLGISANYYISPKVGVGIGLNILSPKPVSGTFTVNNHQYTITDTGKGKTYNTGKLSVASSRKLYTIDVPVTATYKLNNIISFNAGPVFSLPVKQTASKNILGPLGNKADTAIIRDINAYANAATINNKLNFSISGGVRVTVKRFYFDAGYQQGITPYSISTAFGSNKIYYHTAQFGIGFLLFKPKTK